MRAVLGPIGDMRWASKKYSLFRQYIRFRASLKPVIPFKVGQPSVLIGNAANSAEQPVKTDLHPIQHFKLRRKGHIFVWLPCTRKRLG